MFLMHNHPMFAQIEFFEPIPCSQCGHTLMPNRIVVEPLANRDGTPFEYETNNSPKGFLLGMKCFHCNGEAQFVPKVVNSRMHPQPNPPSNITKASPYVLAINPD
jgi:hypothetical protein